MNEFLRNFIMTGIRDMISRDVALYQTYQYASGWFSKNVLTQEDLEEIQKLYEEKEMQKEVENEMVEDVVEDAVAEETTESEDTVEEVTEESEGA